MVEIPVWYWFAFGALVAVLLTLDLTVFHRDSRDTTIREAAFSTFAWLLLALVFDGLVWYVYDRQGQANGVAGAGLKAAVDFLTGYLVEWSLSMDNVFVFAVIFTYFKVPKAYQYRVLFWGILGAIVMRLVFILLGTALIQQFHWILYVLGLFLIYTGIQLVRHDDEVDPEQSYVLKFARRWLPVTTGEHGDRFFVREAGKLAITPLFLVLLVVESTDVAFAFDSVPAIFGVTEDPYIVFTSNIFAILGLRALYFLLAGFMDLFRFLKYGLAAILVFIGCRMLLEIVHVEIPAWVALPIVFGLLATSMAVSLLMPHPPADADAPRKQE